MELTHALSIIKFTTVTLRGISLYCLSAWVDVGYTGWLKKSKPLPLTHIFAKY